MPLPDFQSAMLPILKLTADGHDHTLAEAVEAIAREFKATDAERNELLPSGRHRVIYSRVGWAKTHLQKAGLLQAKGRGRFRISSRGLEVVKRNPPRVDIQLLKEFPEYIAFVGPRQGLFRTFWSSSGNLRGGARSARRKTRGQLLRTSTAPCG